MKKSILIFSVVILALLSIVISIMYLSDAQLKTLEISESENMAMSNSELDKITNRIFADFIYDVGPRFNPIKKSKLETIKSFNDLLDEEHAQRIIDYQSVSVVVIINDEKSEVHETSNSGEFTEAQIKLMQSSNYSTNLLISADFQEKNKENGAFEGVHWTPYLTVVPEKQAEYFYGKDALKKYLKENSEDARINVIAEKLQPAKLYFTVTKKGTIENVRLDRTSYYPEVDERMIELITNLSGKWLPAENKKGEKVDQELVVSFGLLGC